MLRLVHRRLAGRVTEALAPTQQFLCRGLAALRFRGLQRVSCAWLGRFQSAHSGQRPLVFSHGAPCHRRNSAGSSAATPLEASPAESPKSLTDLALLPV